jgi:hypothetical protein
MRRRTRRVSSVLVHREQRRMLVLSGGDSQECRTWASYGSKLAAWEAAKRLIEVCYWLGGRLALAACQTCQRWHLMIGAGEITVGQDKSYRIGADGDFRRIA